MTLPHHIQESVEFIANKIPARPTVGLILGSGLGAFADTLEDRVVLPYGELPHFPVSHVAGHAGNLVIGRLGPHTVAVMQGRVHFYEGYPMETVVFPARVLVKLGCARLVITNAAGGVGDHQAGTAQFHEHPGGEDHRLHGIALVEVHASLHHGDRVGAQAADHQVAGVSGHVGDGKMGELSVGQDHAVLERVGEGAQAGSEDQPHGRARGNFIGNEFNAFLDVVRQCHGRHFTPPGAGLTTALSSRRSAPL